MRAVIIIVCAPSRRPLKPMRRRWSCSAVITTLAATVPMISPAIPSGLYRPTLTMMSTTMFIAARRVGIHGRCTAKNVRVSSRLSPPKGRLKANQNSAIETSSVECALKWPRSKRSRTIGVASTIMNAAAGISSRLIWRMPMPIARRMSRRRRGARPCGSASGTAPWRPPR